MREKLKLGWLIRLVKHDSEPIITVLARASIKLAVSHRLFCDCDQFFLTDPYRVGVPPAPGHLRTERVPVSITLCSLVSFRIPGDGKRSQTH